MRKAFLFILLLQLLAFMLAPIAGADDEYTMQYLGNLGVASPVFIYNMQAEGEVDFFKIKPYGYSLHRHTWYDANGQVRTDIIAPKNLYGDLPRYDQLIWNPLIIPRDYGSDILYYAYDIGGYPRTPDGRGIRIFDRIYIINHLASGDIFPDLYSPASLQNRRLLVSINPNDLTLGHSSDPDILKVGPDKYRIYYAMDALQDPSRVTSGDPATWGGPSGRGVMVGWIAYVEFEGDGRFWQQKTVDRNNRVKVYNFPNPAKVLLYRPAVIYYNGWYYLYADASWCDVRTEYAYLYEAVAGDVCGCQSPCASTNGCSNWLNLVYAVSADGVNFYYQGAVKDARGNLVKGYDNEAKLYKDKFIFAFSSGNLANNDAMLGGNKTVLTFGYIDPAKPGVFHVFDANKNGVEEGYNTDGILYYSSYLATNGGDGDRIQGGGDISPYFLIAGDRLRGIWNAEGGPGSPGLWNYVNNRLNNEPNYYFSHITANWLQKHAQFTTVEGRVYDYQTAYGPGQIWLSSGPVATANTDWVVHKGNTNNPRGNEIKQGYWQIYNYDGTLLYRSPTAVTVKPGDVWTLERNYISPGDSIQAAIDRARPGDIIRLAPGDYYEPLDPTTREANIDINKSVTLKSQDAAHPAKIHLNGRPIIITANAVTISNLIIDNSISGAPGGQGLEVWWTILAYKVNNLKIENNIIRADSIWGIDIENPGTGIRIYNNLIYTFYNPNLRIGNKKGNRGMQGILVKGLAKNPQVDLSGVTIEQNTVHNFTWLNVYLLGKNPQVKRNIMYNLFNYHSEQGNSYSPGASLQWQGTFIGNVIGSTFYAKVPTMPGYNRYLNSGQEITRLFKNTTDPASRDFFRLKDDSINAARETERQLAAAGYTPTSVGWKSN